MLKEMTIANGLYKTNEPVLITTHRLTAYTHTHFTNVFTHTLLHALLTHTDMTQNKGMRQLLK